MCVIYSSRARRVKRDGRAAERAPLAAVPQPNAAPALLTLGGFSFSRDELGAPSLVNGERLVFAIPPRTRTESRWLPVSRGLST